MSSSREQVLLQRGAENDQLRANQRLRNEVLDVLERIHVGWCPQSLSSIGESCVNQLTAALWYIDAHHKTLRERGLRIYKDLSHVHSFNDWQKKIKKPKLSTQGLDGHVQSLSQQP